MNFAVGTDNISEAARSAIVKSGGVINPTHQTEVSMISLPEEFQFTGSGDHGYIALSQESVLHFIRAWNTKDCRLELCQ